MATVIKNEAVGKDFYLLKASGNFNAKIGQFCMLRAWDEYPVLSRPISIFDCGNFLRADFKMWIYSNGLPSFM